MHKKYQSKNLERIQRLMLLKLVNGYRAISYDALLLWRVQNQYSVHPGNIPKIYLAHVETDDNYTYIIFTDVSQTEVTLGGAMVVYSEEIEIAYDTFYMNGMCSNNRAEMYVIF